VGKSLVRDSGVQQRKWSRSDSTPANDVARKKGLEWLGLTSRLRRNARREAKRRCRKRYVQIDTLLQRVEDAI